MCKVKGFDKKPAVKHCQTPGRVKLLRQGLLFLLENVLKDRLFQSQQFLCIRRKIPCSPEVSRGDGLGFLETVRSVV